MSVSKLKDLSALSDNLLSLQPHEGYLEAADAFANLRGAHSIVANVADQYARSYASVQSVQYDADGNIEDVTTNEALSIPRNVFKVAITNLTEWKDKLTAKLGLLGTVPVSKASITTYTRFDGDGGRYTATRNGMSFIPFTNHVIWTPANTPTRYAIGSRFLLSDDFYYEHAQSLTMNESHSYVYTFARMPSTAEARVWYPIFQMLVTKYVAPGQYQQKLLVTGSVLPDECELYQSEWLTGGGNLMYTSLNKSGVIYRADYPALWTAAGSRNFSYFSNVIQLFVTTALGPGYNRIWTADPNSFNYAMDESKSYLITELGPAYFSNTEMGPNVVASATTDLTGFVPDISDTIAILNNLA